jgi:hypothetical protein
MCIYALHAHMYIHVNHDPPPLQNPLLSPPPPPPSLPLLLFLFLVFPFYSCPHCCLSLPHSLPSFLSFRPIISIPTLPVANSRAQDLKPREVVADEVVWKKVLPSFRFSVIALLSS